MNSYLKYKFLPKHMRKRWTYEDFLAYRMQELSVTQIESILTVEELWEAEKQLNSNEYRHVFNSKKAFSKHFGQFMIRDILYLSEASLADFKEFISKHGKIILKPDDMYAGLGICILTAEADGLYILDGKTRKNYNYDDVWFGYESLHSSGYVAEEYVLQADKYASVYPGALNTIRVTTLIDDEGMPEILFVVNQFGSKGSIVDNDDESAIWAEADKDTGKIISCDIDDKTGYVNEVHPDTSVNLLEFVNDDIGAICKLALDAALVIPDCRLVGWDIAVRADGRLDLIEGNVTPELELYQKMTGKGLGDRIARFL